MPLISLKKYHQSADKRTQAFKLLFCSDAVRLFFLLSCATVFAFGCASVKPEQVRPWNTFLHDASRLNYNEEPLALPLESSWSKDVSPFKLYNKFPKEQLSTPAISNGILYTGSTNGKFYALSADNGWAEWRYIAEYPLEGAPTVTDGFVCFGAGDGVLRCLDKKNGKEAWRYQARSEIISSPLASPERVYVYSSDDRIHALDLKTGEKLWIYSRGVYQTITPRLSASPAASDDFQKIYQLFSDGNLVCLSAATGKPVWIKKVLRSFDASDRLRRTPAVFDGSVYVIDDTNTILALNADTGELKNIYNVIKANDFVIVNKRQIAIAGVDRAVLFDMLTGAILWNTEIKHSPLSSLFAAGDYLFVLSNYEYAPLGIDFLSSIKGYVSAIKLKTGEVAWGYRFGTTLSANASYSERHIALLSDGGKLKVFKAR